MQFNERLKQLRAAAGMTQESLARKSGLTSSAVSKLEQRAIDPSWSTVQALAKALGVTCEAFSECEDVAVEETPPAKRTKKPARRRKE